MGRNSGGHKPIHIAIRTCRLLRQALQNACDKDSKCLGHARLLDSPSHAGRVVRLHTRAMRKLTVTCVILTGGGMWKRAAVVVFRDRLAMSYTIDIEEYGEHQRIRHLRYVPRRPEPNKEEEPNPIIAECRKLQAEMGSATAELLDEEAHFKDDLVRTYIRRC